MRMLILLMLVATGWAQDAATVEIEKQRLIKFPDEFESSSMQSMQPEKVDEAKRILDQIAKVNEAFGYVKKQPEQPKLPPILDSSQYLFPKPAYQPFHAQQHHFAGSNGQTLLEPSIRAVKLTRDYNSEYNLPPIKQKQKPMTKTKKNSEQLYFRPNQVYVPRPENPSEAKQLPTHFAVPVHLYKLNKEEYLREKAPQEYRVKGYKIIGDIDSFYGKAKSSSGVNKKQGKTSPKYHLFFLPRELALNENGTAPTLITNGTTTVTSPLPSKESRLEEGGNGNGGGGGSREKLIQRPILSPQSTRRRPGSKPLRNKETQINSLAEQSIGGHGGYAASLSSQIKITPAPQLSPPPQSPNRLTPFRVPQVNLVEMQNHTTSVIKNAFQNIFKPFRSSTTASPTILESVPLQAAPLSLLSPLSSSGGGSSYGATPESISVPDDYKWDDDREGAGDGAGGGDFSENNAAEVDSSVSAEKHLFGVRPPQLPNPFGQRQALREPGIVIQRLKVRKGGIAIAGPGGVATAGSGGTAIVGPGGYALTHPRSLTIAGPGAKVIAIPSDVDLRDALQRTNLEEKSFPREGKVVAIGPTVYYAPPTALTKEEDEEEEEEQQQPSQFHISSVV